MSSDSTSSGLKEYLVLVPDFPGKLSNRMGAKSAHIEGAMPMINGGRLPYFGVTLVKHAEKEGDQPVMNGSLMIIKAKSEISIRDFLEKDAYTKAGVWDIANAKILPFKAG